MTGTTHIYAKASLVSLAFSFLVQHQAELSTIATCIGILAGVISIWKGVRGK